MDWLNAALAQMEPQKRQEALDKLVAAFEPDYRDYQAAAWKAATMGHPLMISWGKLSDRFTFEPVENFWAEPPKV